MAKEREPHQWEKDQIRTQLEQAVARKATATEIDQIRRDLAKVLDLTYPQVKAIGAWKKKAGHQKLVLEVTAIADPKKLNQKNSDENEELTNKLDEQNLAELNHKTDDRTLQQLYADTQMNVIHEDQKIADDTMLSATSLVSYPNYNNPEKASSRIAFREFIQKEFPEKSRKTANVFILPGPDWLEVEEIFDQLGFDRKRIWGAEMDPALQAACAHKAVQLGTNFFPGKAEEFFNKTKDRFAIINLDFKGQLCEGHLKLFENLPLEDTATVSGNFWRKRERKSTQRLIQSTEKNRSIIRQFYPELLGNISEYPQILEKMQTMESNAPLPSFQNSSESTWGFVLCTWIGVARKEKWNFDPNLIEKIRDIEKIYSKFVDEFSERFNGNDMAFALFSEERMFFGKKLLLLMRPIITSIASALKNQTDLSEAIIINLATSILPFLQYVLASRHLIMNLEDFTYKSPENNATYMSHFISLKRPHFDYMQMRNTANVLLEIAIDAYKAKEAGNAHGNIQLEDQQRRLLGKKETLIESDRFVYTQNGKLVSVLRVRDLIRDLGKIMNLKVQENSSFDLERPSDAMIESFSRLNRVILEKRR